MHYCAYCGTPFSSESNLCPHCGSDKSVTQPVTPKVPTTPFAPSTPYPSAPEDVQQSSSPPQSADVNRSDQPDSPNIAYQAPAFRPPEQQGSVYPYQHQQAGSYPQNVMGMGISTATMPPPLKPASRLLVTGVILLSAFLVASGFGLLYYAGVSRPTQIHVQATATMKRYNTSVAQATNTAQQQATATTLAQNKAIATANAQATVQAVATIMAFQNMLAQNTRGIPDISSPLAFEDGPNWDIYPTQDGGGCAFTNNALHSSVFQPDYYTPCLAHATNYQNFALEVQINIQRGDEGGIILRSDAASKNFYSFRIRSDGTYAFVLTHDNGHATLLVYDKSNLIKIGNNQVNTLSLIARGSNFYLYINQQYIGSTNDNSYSAGAIGVMALDHTNKTDCAFTNLRVWKL